MTFVSYDALYFYSFLSSLFFFFYLRVATKIS